MSENNKYINWELAARVLNGEADEIDRGLLNQWLNADSENRHEWDQMKKSWEMGGEALRMKEIDTHAAWNRVRRFIVDEKNVSKSRFRTPLRIVSSIAAVFIFIFGVVWFLAPMISGNQASLILSNSEREEIILDDGSIVNLNSDSKMSCPQPFDKYERTVDLNGEGYFVVEGDPERPFVVRAGSLSIRVTGTRFNVRDYPTLEVAEVAVVEGSVELLVPYREDVVSLTKGQTALFEKQSGDLLVKNSTDPNLLAWITRKISFNKTPLWDVIETLERVYDVNIQVSDESLLEERLTARFSENSLDFVLQVVCVTFNLEMQREGNTVFFSRIPETE
jgi:transmembrane sensor